MAERVTVATKAQKKLRHMVLMLKTLLISYRRIRRSVDPLSMLWMNLTSIEKSTPPIGDPNATATPAALEAVNISRIFTDKRTFTKGGKRGEEGPLTLTSREVFEHARNDVPNRTRDVH